VRAGRLLILASAALLAGCVSSSRGNRTEAGTDVAMGCQDVTGPVPGTPVATFDTDIEQFVFDVSHYGITDAGITITNLADPTTGTTPPPSLSYDGSDGNPSPGSLQIAAPFSGANQLLVAFRSDCSAIHDWTGTTLRARIKVMEGDYTGQAYLYVGTSPSCSTWAFGYAKPVSLAHTSCWQELSLDVSNPNFVSAAGYDPTAVTTFGVQFATYGVATPVTFLVDSFSVE
jgi:hypothetical protein